MFPGHDCSAFGSGPVVKRQVSDAESRDLCDCFGSLCTVLIRAAAWARRARQSKDALRYVEFMASKTGCSGRAGSNGRCRRGPRPGSSSQTRTQESIDVLAGRQRYPTRMRRMSANAASIRLSTQLVESSAMKPVLLAPKSARSPRVSMMTSAMKP